MIKISHHQKIQRGIIQKIVDSRVKRLTKQLIQVNFNISDQNCQFQINQNICIKLLFYAIQIKAKPLVGLYQNIDFLVNLYFQSQDILTPPKIINNRRIFHPNLNPYTLEFALPELVNWIPPNNIVHLLYRLKYTIIQPNVQAIPNNPICRKAAYLYQIDRQNFRSYIITYCPTVLQNTVLSQYNTDNNSIANDMQQQNNSEFKKYVKIDEILPISRLTLYEENLQIDDSLQFLNKRMSTVNLQDDKQNDKQNQNVTNNYQEDWKYNIEQNELQQFY